MNKASALCYIAFTLQAGRPTTVEDNGLAALRIRQLHEEHMMMPTSTVIEVAAKEVAAELKRQGISPDERVILP